MRDIIQIVAAAIVALALFIAGAAVKVATDARDDAQRLAAQVAEQEKEDSTNIIAMDKLSDQQKVMLDIVDGVLKNQKRLVALHDRLSKRVAIIEGS